MATPSRRKSELATRLLEAGRDTGTAALMFHQAVADRLGLNPSDHKCLDLLRSHENSTAGDLADWTGLTTGAVTGIIDRLEQAGFVRREPHPKDRRKVVVQTVAEKLPQVCQLFGSMCEQMTSLAARYTEEELKTILDYQVKSAEIFRRETQRLRDAGR